MAELREKSQEWMDKSPLFMNSFQLLNQTIPMLQVGDNSVILFRMEYTSLRFESPSLGEWAVSNVESIFNRLKLPLLQTACVRQDNSSVIHVCNLPHLLYQSFSVSNSEINHFTS